MAHVLTISLVDDTAIMGKTTQGLHDKVNILVETGRKFGMGINIYK
jgi:hypothetical protein